MIQEIDAKSLALSQIKAHKQKLEKLISSDLEMFSSASKRAAKIAAMAKVKNALSSAMVQAKDHMQDGALKPLADKIPTEIVMFANALKFDLCREISDNIGLTFAIVVLLFPYHE